MPDASTLKALADAGGWAVCLLLAGLIGLGATKKFRWWVPGWIYEDERNQRRISEAQSDRTTKAIQRLATAFGALAREFTALKAAFAEMVRENERLHAELAAIRAELVNRE